MGFSLQCTWVRTTKYIYTKSTTVSVPSLELGPPRPSLNASVLPPGAGGGGGYTHACGGGGVPIQTTGEKADYYAYSVVRTEDAWKGVQGRTAEEEYMREEHGKG